MSIRVRALFEHHFALNEAFPLKKRAVQNLVKRVAGRAGITSACSPHVLRQPFAVLAIQKGISLPCLQRILGHDRLETTQIYLNLQPQHVLDEYFAKW